jgi:alpha-galactosidase
MILVGIPRLTTEKYRTHYMVRTGAASPIIPGNDPQMVTPAIKRIVANRQVIAVDQHALGIRGRRMVRPGKAEIWTSRLANGSTAVAVFNRGDAPAAMIVRWQMPVWHGQAASAISGMAWMRQSQGITPPKCRATVP